MVKVVMVTSSEWHNIEVCYGCEVKWAGLEVAVKIMKLVDELRDSKDVERYVEELENVVSGLGFSKDSLVVVQAAEYDEPFIIVYDGKCTVLRIATEKREHVFS